MNRHFMKEDNIMANKHKKRFLTSSAIKEIQIKITMICHFTLTTMAIIFKSFKTLKRVMASMRSNWNSHTLLVRMQNGMAILKTAWQFFIKLNIHLSYGPVIPLLGICPREMEILILYLSVNAYALSCSVGPNSLSPHGL